MNIVKVEQHIIKWLTDYVSKSGLKGFVVGVSGGIDSAVTSTLCAKTGYPTLLLNMPIHQKSRQFKRSNDHISWLEKKHDNFTEETPTEHRKSGTPIPSGWAGRSAHRPHTLDIKCYNTHGRC